MYYMVTQSVTSNNRSKSYKTDKNIAIPKVQVETKNKRSKIINNELTILLLALSSILLHIIGLFVDTNLACLVASLLLGILLLSSYSNWIRITVIIDTLIESFSLNIFQHLGKDISDHYSDYLIDEDSNEVYVTQRTRRLKRNRNLVCNGIYTLTNLVWPLWLILGRMENIWCEYSFRQPPFMNLIGLLPICVGFPVSFICNKKIKRKTHISDTEDTVESLIFSVLAQVLVFWLIRKCFVLAKLFMLFEHDLLQISIISEGRIFILCTSVALIQIFCTQSKFLVLCPILYIMSSLT